MLYIVMNNYIKGSEGCGTVDVGFIDFAAIGLLLPHGWTREHHGTWNFLGRLCVRYICGYPSCIIYHIGLEGRHNLHP